MSQDDQKPSEQPGTTSGTETGSGTTEQPSPASGDGASKPSGDAGSSQAPAGNQPASDTTDL